MKFEKCLTCAYKGKLIQKCSNCEDQSNYKHVFEPLITNGNHTCLDCANSGKRICHDCDMGDKFKWEESKLSLTVPPLEDIPIHADGEYTVTRNVPQKETDLVEIATSIAKFVEMKNNDYGSAFAKGLDEFGYYEYLVLLGHKYRRIKSLTVEGTKQMIEDEKINDTLIDIIGYSLQLIKYLNEKDNDNE